MCSIIQKLFRYCTMFYFAVNHRKISECVPCIWVLHSRHAIPKNIHKRWRKDALVECSNIFMTLEGISSIHRKSETFSHAARPDNTERSTTEIMISYDIIISEKSFLPYVWRMTLFFIFYLLWTQSEKSFPRRMNCAFENYESFIKLKILEQLK